MQRWFEKLRPGRRVLTALISGVVAFLGLACTGDAREGPPNVVLIVLDTVRADGIGGQLAGHPVTPNLDRLLGEGATFSNAFANAPWTVPSHATLFTGLYPHRHGAVHQRFVLDEGLETAAEILAGKNYLTHGITSNPWLHARGGFRQGFQTYDEVFRQAKDAVDKGADLATRRAVKWVAANAGGERPFFLFVNYNDAHLPYDPPTTILESFGLDEETLARRRFTIAEAEAIIGEKTDAGEEELELARTLYRLEIAYLDRKLGELVGFLEERKILDETLLVITADHGEHLAEHDLMGHEFSLFDPVLRVPLILRFPERVEAGQRVELPVSHVDVLPTILDAIGDEERIQGLPGRSLLDPEGLASERPLVAEYARPRRLIHGYWKSKHPEMDLSAFDVGLRSIRRGQHKLILTSRGDLQLYDTAEDPNETRDVLEERGEEAARLQRELEQLTEALGSANPPERSAE